MGTIKYNYILNLESKKVVAFLEVSADDPTIEPSEYRQGHMDVSSSIKRHGLMKYGNIAIKHGIIYDMDFLRWMLDCEKGISNRKTLKICLCDDMSHPIAEWEIVNARVVKCLGVDLKEETTYRKVQRIELVHEGLKRL